MSKEAFDYVYYGTHCNAVELEDVNEDLEAKGKRKTRVCLRELTLDIVPHGELPSWIASLPALESVDLGRLEAPKLRAALKERGVKS